MSKSELTELGRRMGHYGELEQRSDGVTIPYDCNDFAAFIPAPVPPVKPIYEPEPDMAQDWYGWVDARWRNNEANREYFRELEKYRAQMEYYNSVIRVLADD